MKKLCGIKETEKCAEEIAADLLSSGLSKRATVVGLSGDLGSGKTAFTKMLAKALGITETVLSPTFVIMKCYRLHVTGYKFLFHIDAYRLDSAEELRALGWDEILAEPRNLIVIEWPERVKKLLPKDAREIKFKFIDDKTREIEWK
jgi:tRNA threonylcarbamoyladenosine biosynthesis protein TsaE